MTILYTWPEDNERTNSGFMWDKITNVGELFQKFSHEVIDIELEFW